MFSQLNDAARLALRLAEHEARCLRHEDVRTEDLLLALAQLHECVAARVLRRAGIDLEGIRLEVAKLVRVGGAEVGERCPLTPGCRQALEHASAAAGRLGHAQVGTGHLLLGLLEEGRGVGFRVLCKLGIGRLGGNLSRVAEHVMEEMNEGFS